MQERAKSLECSTDESSTVDLCHDSVTVQVKICAADASFTRHITRTQDCVEEDLEVNFQACTADCRVCGMKK